MGSKDKDFVTREEFEDWGLRVDRLDAGINEIVRDFVEELSQHIEALESEVGVLQAIIFGPMNAVPTNVRGVGGVGLQVSCRELACCRIHPRRSRHVHTASGRGSLEAQGGEVMARPKTRDRDHNGTVIRLRKDVGHDT